jgi:hypothetical protein
VALWGARAYGQRLDRADLNDRKSGRAWNRTASEVEQRIAEFRVELRESILGESGARAIHSVLQAEREEAPAEVRSTACSRGSDCRTACAAFADLHRRKEGICLPWQQAKPKSIVSISLKISSSRAVLWWTC